MNRTEFAAHLENAVNQMTTQAQAGMPGYSNSIEFEQTVLAQLTIEFNEVAEANPTFHNSAFPDLVVNGFGVEVKFTNRPSWQGTGNSIFEGMRDPAAHEIALIFYRADIHEVRWRWYENCIRGIRISHSPRYMVEMVEECSFFDEIAMSMNEFRGLDLRNKMEIVKTHIRNRVGEGERFWWFDEDREHTLPINIQLYRHLDPEKKEQMRAEAALMCPQIFKGSRQKGKYDDAALYLLTQHGVFAPQTRDLFSAGSVAGRARGGDYLLRSIQNITPKIKNASYDLNDDLFVEYWGESCPPEDRIQRWLEKVDSFRPNNPPSEHLNFD